MKKVEDSRVNQTGTYIMYLAITLFGVASPHRT